MAEALRVVPETEEIHMNYAQDLEYIANHYGIAQLDQAVEELSELILAIQKYKRCPRSSQLYDITQEISDVEIMTAQLRIVLELSDSLIEYSKQRKIARQLIRIEEATTAHA